MLVVFRLLFVVIVVAIAIDVDVVNEFVVVDIVAVNDDTGFVFVVLFS